MRATERKQQLAEQLLYKAKEMELLISVLPSPSDLKSATSVEASSPSIQTDAKNEADLQAEDTDAELLELEKEMQDANREYLEVLSTAGEFCVIIANAWAAVLILASLTCRVSVFPAPRQHTRYAR